MKICTSILLFLFALSAEGQYLKTKLQTDKGDAYPMLSRLLPDSISTNERSLYRDRILIEAYALGYLGASVSLKETIDSLVYFLEEGNSFKYGKINWLIPDDFVLPALQDANIFQRSFTSKEWSSFINRYLDYYENNGYPFIQIEPKHVNFYEDTVYAEVIIKPGPKITLDSLAIKGFDEFSSNVIKYDLGFRKGMLYRENYLTELQNSVEQIEYLRFARNPGVAFFKDKPTLYLYMEKVPGNQISGVGGINTKENGDITFNGDFELRLLNSFKGGEDIYLRWRRPDDNQQFLNISLTFPYLFKTPLWASGALEILRQDSSFVTTSLDGELKYLLSGRNFLVGGIEYASSNTLQSDVSTLALKSYKSYRYKIGAEINQTNRILIPNKGYILNILPFSGSRITADTSTRQFGWDIQTSLFSHVKNGHYILNRIRSESLFGTGLFDNELYRIGGLKSMRGFNEQSIYTSVYGIYTLEYRYFFGTYDYLAVFGDLAYTEKKTVLEDNANWLTGTGAGINFYTKGGIFSMFFAVGKTQDTPFDLRTVKVHFGYVNRF